MSGRDVAYQGANHEPASQLLEEYHGCKNLKCPGHCLQLSIKSGLSIYQIEQMIAVALKLLVTFDIHVVHQQV